MILDISSARAVLHSLRMDEYGVTGNGHRPNLDGDTLIPGLEREIMMCFNKHRKKFFRRPSDGNLIGHEDSQASITNSFQDEREFFSLI